MDDTCIFQGIREGLVVAYSIAAFSIAVENSAAVYGMLERCFANHGLPQEVLCHFVPFHEGRAWNDAPAVTLHHNAVVVLLGARSAWNSNGKEHIYDLGL